MVGQNFFAEKFGSIYDFSLVKYYCGQGELLSSESSFNIDWELCLDITGEINLVLSSKKKIEFTDNRNNYIEYCMGGLTFDSIWNIECTQMVIHTESFDLDHDTYTYYGSCITLAMKKMNKYKDKSFTLAKAYINNLYFKGDELTENKNISREYNKFSVNTCDRTFKFALNPYGETIKKMIDDRKIGYAVLSNLELVPDENEEILEILKEVRSICSFLELLTLNNNQCSMIELYNNDDLVYIGMQDYPKEAFHNNYLVDNIINNGGIKQAIQRSYHNYKELNASIDIDKFITFIRRVQTEEYIELKFSALILSYEYLLSKYLIFKEQIDESRIWRYKIQKKIEMVKEILGIVYDDTLGNDLRRNVRNPLFHQGMIALINLETKVEYFNRYYDLLVRIVLKILDYKGMYFSRITYMSEEIE